MGIILLGLVIINHKVLQKEDLQVIKLDQNKENMSTNKKYLVLDLMISVGTEEAKVTRLEQNILIDYQMELRVLWIIILMYRKLNPDLCLVELVLK